MMCAPPAHCSGWRSVAAREDALPESFRARQKLCPRHLLRMLAGAAGAPDAASRADRSCSGWTIINKNSRTAIRDRKRYIA